MHVFEKIKNKDLSNWIVDLTLVFGKFRHQIFLEPIYKIKQDKKLIGQFVFAKGKLYFRGVILFSCAD